MSTASSPTRSPLFNLLAAMHGVVAGNYLANAVFGLLERTEVRFQFTVACTSALIAWGVYRRSRWTIPLQVLLWVLLLWLGLTSSTHVPMDPIASLFNFVAILALTIGPALLGLLSTVLLLRHRRIPSDPASGAFIVERTLALGFISVLIAWGDFYMPSKIRREESALAQRKAMEQIQAAEATRQRRQKDRAALSRAFAELQEALAQADLKQIAATEQTIAKLRVQADPDPATSVLLDADESVQIQLLDQAISGRTAAFEYEDLLASRRLTDAVRERARIAQRRQTIQTMYQPGYGTVRRMGALKELSHAKVVSLLIEALADREHTTKQERIDLALALQETAELDDFDASPAIPVLETIIASEDAPEVQAAVQGALKAAQEQAARPRRRNR